ncbi:MAG: hypothetical protein NZM37_11760 [Sandaracinaceae bacterium]|nr:hypothetical protein [Sandaracinaceae bacterium]MDW8246429.1 hypothetical protein [Sandaracinaceae bacterium]
MRSADAHLPPWLKESLEAIEKGEPLGEGAELFRARFPPILEGEGSRGLTLPLLAAVAWLGAHLREELSSAFDAIALLMRFLAWMLSVQAFFAFVRLLGRFRKVSRRAWLLIHPEGLACFDGQNLAFLSAKSILGIAQSSHWSERRAGRRWEEIFAVGLDPQLKIIAIPPLFGDSAMALAEALMRRFPSPPERPIPLPDPQRPASLIYERAKKGMEPQALPIPLSRFWWRRGPYTAMLLALALLEPLARGATSPIPPISMLFIAGLSIMAPLLWFLTQFRSLSPRMGLACVLTPAELLWRSRAGIHRLPWKNVEEVSISTRWAFLATEGLHRQQALLIKTREDFSLRFDESVVGIPLDAFELLIQSLRAGLRPDAFENQTSRQAGP